MSGIVGIYLKKNMEGRIDAFIDEAVLMAESLVNPYSQKVDIAYKDKRFILSFVQRPSFDKNNPVVSVFQSKKIITLVDGRVYLDSDQGTPQNCAQYFANEYGGDLTNKTELSEDGEYIVVMYDKIMMSLTLASDYFGHRALYVYEDENAVYFASEVKAFIFIESFSSEISTKSIVNYFEYGVLPENNTWFNGVRMIGPGEALSFEGESKWSSNIDNCLEKNKEKIEVTFDDALKETHRLFNSAISKRLPPSDNKSNIAVKLSGGLDSRAVLASLYSEDENVTTFTFSKKKSYDFRIASMVVRKLSIKHIKTEIDEKNWFSSRIKAVWDIDGQLDMRHMYGVVDMHKYSNYNLHFSGVLGGAIIGGFFREKWPALSPIDVIRYRLRRFSGTSMLYSTNFIEERMRFYDLELNKFLLSLPPEYLSGSKLYNKMLLTYYPSVFKMIPWQHTMLPLWMPSKFHTYSHKFISIVSNLQMRKSKTYLEWRFSNEELWARQEPVCTIINDFLLSDTPLYAAYIDKTLTQNKVKSYLKGNNRVINFVLRLLTIEVWLQSIKSRAPICM